MADDRRQLLALAWRLLGRDQSPAPELFEVVLRALDGSQVLTFRSRPGEFSAGVVSRLPPLETAILQTLTAEPQPAKVLARKLARRLDSHFYAALRSLLRHDPPRAVRVTGGYRLP